MSPESEIDCDPSDSISWLGMLTLVNPIRKVLMIVHFLYKYHSAGMSSVVAGTLLPARASNYF